MAFIQSQKDLRFVSEKSFILLLSLISLRILSQEWNFNFIKSSSKLTEKIISIFFFSLLVCLNGRLCGCYCLVTQLCPTLCDPMDCSTPGSPVLHYLPEFAQTHVHWVDDAIQPSYPLSSLFPLPSNFPSIRVFSNESALGIRWPKY